MKSGGSTFAYFAAVLCCVFTLGVVTNNAVEEVVQLHDKVVHFIAFCIESWLFCQMIASRVIKFKYGIGRNGSDNGEQNYRYRQFQMSKFTLALVVCMGAAVASEFMQQGLSGGKRSFDPLDMVYNVLGSSLGIAIAYRYE